MSRFYGSLCIYTTEVDDCLMLPYNVHKPLFSPKNIGNSVPVLFHILLPPDSLHLQAYIHVRKLRKLI